MGGVSVPVNTHHHQGLDDVADELDCVGWAEDGVLEAVVSKENSWVVGVQWHPEAMAPVHDEQLAIFKEFVAAAATYLRSEERLTARSA
jgi:putative glutamine amidotransferase